MNQHVSYRALTPLFGNEAGPMEMGKLAAF